MRKALSSLPSGEVSAARQTNSMGSPLENVDKFASSLSDLRWLEVLLALTTLQKNVVPLKLCGCKFTGLVWRASSLPEFVSLIFED